MVIIEAALAQQLAGLLAPALPYLIGPAAAAGQKAAEAVAGKIGEDTWNKAKEVWGKLKPWADKNPEAAKALKEAADNADNPIYMNALPLSLTKLLENMPEETVNEIRSIVISQTRTDYHVTKADSGGIAIGGNVSGGTISTTTTTYQGTDKKSDQ